MSVAPFESFAGASRIPADISSVLIDPSAYADGRIHEVYRWLRSNLPLAVAAPEGFDPFWVVTKHADIQQVGRQSDIFRSGDRSTLFVDQNSDQLTRKLTGGSPHLWRSLIQMDAPEHLKYRTMTQRWFMPANIKRIQESVAAIADRSIEEFILTGGKCEFVEAIALRYPLRVIMNILGIPPEDEDRMLRLTQDIFGTQDSDMNAVAAELEQANVAAGMAAAAQEFDPYFIALRQDRCANPRDDLATIIANATIEGNAISDQDVVSYYTIVATAGHDTTSSSTAAAIWALAQDPGLLEEVRAEPTLVSNLVDEAIRWMTPVKTFMRSAAQDTELRGQRIPKGSWLMLCYASGNFDEDVFPEPTEFRLDRDSSRNLAFGYGAHMCLGQHLAKMEMRILLERLLPRIKSLRLNGEAQLSQSWFVNGPKRLPIAFELA